MTWREDWRNAVLPDGWRPMPVERPPREDDPARYECKAADGTVRDVRKGLPGLGSSGPDDDYGVKWRKWPP